MKYEIPGTRAYYESIPQMKAISHAHMDTGSVAINCRTYKEECKSANPDKAALEFYALNHLASVVRKNYTLHEKLPTWAVKVMDAYLECLVEQGERLFFYTLLVTTRESRHVKNGQTPDFKSKFVELFGSACHDFNTMIKGSSSDGAVNKFLASPPEAGLGPYLNSLAYIFEHGSFSGGYGGMPWANIAKTIASFVDGKTTLEMMVDTAYTLAHNNGPMFNKGMMYSMYSNNIYKVLDVQRSGQIPELVLSGDVKNLASNELILLCGVVKEKFPTEIGNYVDWYKVEALGSLHKYHGEKAKQDKMSPPPPPMSVEGYKITGTWKVFPGQVVNVHKREPATA